MIEIAPITHEYSLPCRPAETGCTVRLVHGGWAEANAAAREKFSDWGVLLDRFAALAS